MNSFSGTFLSNCFFVLLWVESLKRLHSKASLLKTRNAYPANTSTLNQRWNNADRQCSLTLFQRWYLVENESWADVYLSTLFQCFNVEKTSIKLRRFNLDELMLFQCWNLVKNESWTDVHLSTLFQRWQNNVETTLSKLCWFNVDDPILFQRWYLVENESWVNISSLALLRRWENSMETTLPIALLMFTRKWLKNKTKLIFQV